MKKIILIAFVVSLCLALVSCNTKEEFNGAPNDIPKTATSITFVKL